MPFWNRQIEPRVQGPVADIESFKQEIVEGIETLFVVEFEYNGFPRVVEPYELGISKDGFTLLRGYQLSDEAKGRITEGWKLFRLDYMTFCEVGDETFVPRDEYYELPPEWTVNVIKKI